MDDCSLKNAAIVRDILEGSGVVLATFSGHDHVPIPAYTVSNGMTVTMTETNNRLSESTSSSHAKVYLKQEGSNSMLFFACTA